MALLVAMTIVANAHPVNPATAREVGAKFLHASALLRTDSPSDLQLVSTYHTTNNDAAFYVFNTENGFVIVAADDCAIPILGYSNESVFTADDVPVQMEAYLQQFVKQIQYGIDNHLNSDAATARQWELVRATGFLNEMRGATAVAPLLTDSWGQGCFYNNMCPTDSNGPCGHALTGCVATSFSQILRFWGYPSTGTGSHTYIPSGYPQQTANFGATTYQWSNMPNSLSGSSTTAQVDAISTLMWHCGVAVEMAYGPQGSSAYSGDIVPALVNYFGYSSDASIIYRDNYTASQWLTLIKNCLNLGRPVHYRGTDDNGGGGHAFVCDGYDNNNYLHFNWGWYGNCNNYFADGALNPDTYAFNTSNAAIINIHPNLPSYQVTISSNPTNGGTAAFGAKSDRETTTYDFEDGTMMNWTSLDADGDGYGWVSSNDPGQYHNSGVNLAGTGHGASQAYVISGSWSNSAGIPLTPNNFLISPVKAAYSQISFYACSQDLGYPAEHFGIAVSTTGNTSAANFTTIQEWTLTAKDAGAKSIGRNGDSKDQGAWYNYNVDLSAYAGQDIWVAIRHFNCTDQFILNIDDITLATGGGGGGNSSSAFFEQGQTCNVTATPNSGYYFANWTENGTVVSNTPTYTFTVNGTRNLVANFSTQPQPQQYAITISANPSEGGEVSFGNKALTDRGQWYYYDDGVYANAVGTGGGNFWWAIMLPSGSYSGNALTKVSAYDCEAMTGTASIYQGGANAPSGTAIATVPVTFNGTNQFVEFVFNEPVPLNSQQNVWVVFCNSSGASYPAAVCANTGDANGRWVSLDGSSWVDLTTFDLNYTSMIRAYIEQGASSAVYTEGQSCSVTATPNSGYTFSNWTENGTVVSNSANYTFTVNGNRNLVANFTVSQPQQYNITVSANPSNGGSVSGGGTYNQGANCTVTATANNGYTFNNWTENGSLVSNSANYTFTVNGNHNLVANFTATPPPPQQYTINVSANPSNGGSVSGGGTYNQGVSCSLTATANSGFAFSNWTENGTQVSTNANYTFTVNGNRTLVANFTQAASCTITASADPVEGGVVSGGGTFQQGAVCTLSATPNTGYQFVNWTKNGTVVSTNTSFSFNVTETASYLAHFAIITFSVTVSANPMEGGVVTGTGTYDYGTLVTVTVAPNDLYTFLNWTENGQVVSEDLSYSFAATSNRNLVAQLFYWDDVDEHDAIMVSAYPNPAHDKLYVECGQPIVCCELYTLNGVCMGRVETEAMKAEIPLRGLPSGMYVVKLFTKDNVFTARFVKD